MSTDRAIATLLLIGTLVAVPAHVEAWCRLTSCRRDPSDAEPCVIADSTTCWPLAWQTRCTEISFSVLGSRDLAESDVRQVFADALDRWESVSCDGNSIGLHVDILDQKNQCTRAGHNLEYSNVHSVMFIAKGWVSERKQDPKAFAITLVWNDRRNGDILDADMEINEERGPYGICPDSPEDNCPNGVVDLPNVVTHELGHYFGLAHTTDDPRATMWADAGSRETRKRTLETDDQEGLCAIYPRGSLPEECDPTPRGGLGLDCSTKPNCSCRIVGEHASKSSLHWWVAASLALTFAVRRARGLR